MLVFPLLLKMFGLLMIREKHVTGDLLEPLNVHLVVHPIDLEGKWYEDGFVGELQIKHWDPVEPLIEESFTAHTCFHLFLVIKRV